MSFHRSGKTFTPSVGTILAQILFRNKTFFVFQDRTLSICLKNNFAKPHKFQLNRTTDRKNGNKNSFFEIYNVT
jgi:hypothetical protein